MKFFIDTANLKEIREAASIGILDGVTTNPTLISREEGKPHEIFKAICEIVDGPVSAEAVSLDWEGMVEEGQELAKIHKNIVVKIPMTKDGLKAVKVLADQGIKTNVTLIFSSIQALLAARAGASYVSPFVGRLDDIGNKQHRPHLSIFGRVPKNENRGSPTRHQQIQSRLLCCR